MLIKKVQRYPLWINFYLKGCSIVKGKRRIKELLIENRVVQQSGHFLE